ncbi:zf-HC2 domain-containing protein [Streptosporangium sp. NPDC004379]|uniref:zf-HC2 domain-containing protein n=1 Tax=Streptosporangium sp. NPDC004379 TaxID=3366189 RepID=UPI0036B73B14
MNAQWHLPAGLTEGYVAGRLDAAQVMSVESHLTRCGRCRAAVPYEREWLAESWAAIEDVVGRPRPRLAERVLHRLGVPGHLARLVAATPALGRAWLTAVTLVLAFAVVSARLAVRDPDAVLAFLAAAPVLPLLGIAFAYGPRVDPVHEAQAATPLSGPRLFLLRAVAVLAVAFALTGVAALLLPRPSVPGGSGAAWLLPALALSLAALVLSTRVSPLVAAAALAAAWWGAVLVCGVAAGDRFLPFQPPAQTLYGAAVALLLPLLYARRRRLDPGEHR